MLTFQLEMRTRRKTIFNGNSFSRDLTSTSDHQDSGFLIFAIDDNMDIFHLIWLTKVTFLSTAYVAEDRAFLPKMETDLFEYQET